MPNVSVASGSISVGEFYIVAGTTGTITYDSIPYAIGSTFSAVVGIKTFATSGDAVVCQKLRLSTSIIEHGLTNADLYVATSTLRLSTSIIEYGLNAEDLFSPEKQKMSTSIVEYSTVNYSKIIRRR